MIKRETIDKIIDATRIEEVVSDFVSLRKRGGNWVGLCPFHNEKTPSFSVSPSKGIFKCFGCGEAGDAVRFMMKHENYTYPEALRFLASKYNVEIEEEEMTPEMEEERSERESLMNVLAFASAWFHKQLVETEKGVAIGLSYFQDREFSPATIEGFELGYSPQERDALIKAATGAGYSEDLLFSAGLIIKTEDSVYDRFRGRVIFPIHNASGRVIAFGGRILGAADKTAKYINSPETPVYEKSKVLYGLHLAKGTITKNDVCYLVEGYTDVISLYQAGIKNVVASSGTSLTSEQIRQIKRYSQNVTILYDGDEAGIKASLRGMDMLLAEGLNVRVILFPPGEDPDSYARKTRRNELEEFLKTGARDFITFIAELKKEEAGNDPVRRAGLVREIMTSVALIPDGITRQFYARECARLLDVEEAVLFNELKKLVRKKILSGNRKEEPSLPETEPYFLKQDKLVEADSHLLREKEIIRLLVNYGHMDMLYPKEGSEAEGEDTAEELSITVADYIVQELQHDQLGFTDPIFHELYSYFEKAVDEHEMMPTLDMLIRHTNAKTSNMVTNLIYERYPLSENWAKNHIEVSRETDSDQLFRSIESVVLRFKLDHIELIAREVNEEWKNGDGSGADELLKRKISIDKLRQEICKKLGIVIPK